MAIGSTRQRKRLSPSFFKVIRDPSSPHLVLPKAFVRKYLENIPKNQTLVTATREHSWKLEIVKIGEDYCFGNGWEKLVKDVQLRIRDIVLFWLVNPLTFNVLFLDANGCEKDLPFVKTNDDDDDDKDEAQDTDVISEWHDGVKPENNLCFQKVIAKNKYGMVLPNKFVKAAGLEHVPSLTLKDLEGKDWRVQVKVERYSRTRYRLGAGWSRFREYHKLSNGDLCKFRFNKKECVLNLTHVFKNKRPVIQETLKEKVNRNRVKPPCYSGARVKVEDDWYPTEKPPCGGGGGGKVKTDYESGPEMEVVKRKREWPPVEVKIEDELDPGTMAVKRKMGMPPPEKASGGGGGAVVKPPVSGAERVFRSKHVIYF